MFGNSSQGEMRSQLEDQTVNSSLGTLALSPEKVALTSAGADSPTPPGNMSENPGVEESEVACENAMQNSSQSECGRPRKRKSTSGPPMSCTRLLRLRSKEKSEASEVNNAVVVPDASGEKKRKRRKGKLGKHIVVNEFSRIRGHLRYLLHRLTYEHTLIEAYSGEGWKGQSLEKIKLEKELERAKTQIFRYKLKIRDLFQHLETLLAQGQLPESLFDTDGQIDSEDIFCAKCGSKDLLADNDIILCDGACERGFHQFCLEPPLSKEDIPPDDEGWLCPGCDCKVDCIDLLNDLQGTNVSITDSWEKVFPEEAAAAAASSEGKVDDNSGLPSDDSEDDDYNPDNPDIKKNDSEDENSSDESDFSSASDDLVAASPKDDKILGDHFEDSDDDEDFNPDSSDKDEHVKPESSSSDFTSDSEDVDLVVDTNNSPADELGVSPSLDTTRPNSGSQEGKAEVGRARRNSLKDELSYLRQSDVTIASSKRHIDRLDYKKLHDETYGNVSSDSSDEDFKDGSLTKERKKKTVKASLVSPNGTQADIKDQSGTPKKTAKAALASPNETRPDIKDQNGTPKGSVHTSDRGRHKKSKVGGLKNSVPCSSGKNKPHGDGVIKRLYESFKKNQYPDRDTKGNLGKEVGLTVQQVSKWFENARHSSRHSSRWESLISERASKECTSSPQINGEPLGTESKSIMNDASCNGVGNLEPQNSCGKGEKCQTVGKREGNLLRQEASGEKSRKTIAKNKNTDQGLDDTSGVKTSKKQNVQADSPNSQHVRRSSRLQEK